MQRQAASPGFTLIEVLIGIVVLSIALLAMSSTVVTVINGNALSERLSIATALAQDRMEELKNRAYAAVTSGADGNNPITATGAAGGPYTRTWTVTPGPVTGTITIVVTVAWTQFGATRQVILSTLRAQP